MPTLPLGTQVHQDRSCIDLVARRDAMEVLQGIIGQIRRDRGSATTGFEPDTHYLRHCIPRAEGMALTSYSAEDAPREESLLELLIREDGGIRLICGREPSTSGQDSGPRTDHGWP